MRVEDSTLAFAQHLSGTLLLICSSILVALNFGDASLGFALFFFGFGMSTIIGGHITGQ